MISIARTLGALSLSASLLAGSPALSQTASDTPVIDTTSTGLFTFSAEDKAIRVAAVLVEREEETIPTIVRFIDANGRVLKQHRTELRDGKSVVVELTRAEVGANGDVLVRVQVVHKLPRVRESRYPIVVTAQPIALNGSGRLVWGWNGGICGEPIPPGTKPGASTGSGVWSQCAPPSLTDL